MAGQEEEIKVLGGWFSPYVFRVELALKLKGIPYQVVEQDLANKSPELLKYNPVYKKIPVFLHNGRPICESLMIIEYIDETWIHNPILPHDPYEKAMARFWAYFVDNKVMGALIAIMLSTENEEMQKEVENAKEALQVLEGELKVKGDKFFGGETIGFADVAMSYIPTWVGATEKTVDVKIHDPEKFPLLDEWMHNLTQVPVIKESLPQQDKLAELFKQMRLYKIASAAAGK